MHKHEDYLSPSMKNTKKHYPLQKTPCFKKLWQNSILISALFLSGSIQAKSLALSFDDGLNPQLNPHATSINQQILTQLNQHQIHAIVFPSLVKIGDYQGKQLIAQWNDHGQMIGNHSALHQNLNHTAVNTDTYIQSIIDADTVFSTLSHYQRLYRYPFLKEGDTSEKRDTVHQWLESNHYQMGGVSIDASDWFYNRKYLDYSKQGQTEKITRLKAAYIAHLLDRAEYYDQLARQTIQRSPKHVLLLHVNQINAAFLNDIIRSFQHADWTIISAQDAFKDPIYQQRSRNIPAGESTIWSIAKTQGKALRYPAENSPYEIEHLKQYQLD
jgi:peptidoglycan-N-acetylglucosamine deacetylase